MKLGIIGLGRMGSAIAERVLKAGHEVVAYDPSTEACTEAQKLGASLATLENIALQTQVIWVMVPAGDATKQTLKTLAPLCRKGSIIIDGGNSYYKDSIEQAQLLAQHSIHFLDCGTSGGVKGRELGFSLMIGGEHEAYKLVAPLLSAIAAPEGYGYMGPSGAGHYVKMVHNGIEYALLQAYAEGCHLLKEGHYPGLDLAEVTRVWNSGSIIRSFVAELLHEIFEYDQDLKNVSGAIGENLTGQWTSKEAHERGVPIRLIDESLAIRAWSRQTGGNYGTKVVAMLRKQFGGHALEKPKDEV
jgi:6-phosphogluconate dehydrogenase